MDFGETDAARGRMLAALGARAAREGRRDAAAAEAATGLAARRARLRREAARLFAERGFEAVGFADIAAAAGCAIVSCTHLYRSKTELIYDILSEHVNELHEALDAADPVPLPGERDTQRGLPPLDRLEALTIALLDELARREAAQRVLLAAIHVLPVTSEQNLRFHLRNLVLRFERVLVLAVPRLGRRRALRYPLAASLVAMAAHYVLWFRDDGKLARTEYARLIAHMAVAGGKAAYREQVGKTRAVPPPAIMPEASVLGLGRPRRRGRGLI